LPKNSAKKMAFFIQNKAKLCKKIDHNIGFWEKRHFFAENCWKSQKIVIITSTLGPRTDPGCAGHRKWLLPGELMSTYPKNVDGDPRSNLQSIIWDSLCRNLWVKM
jgi:hypothetical protein